MYINTVIIIIIIIIIIITITTIINLIDRVGSFARLCIQHVFVSVA